MQYISVEPVAFTVFEAVEAARISRSFFYKLLKEGRGPKLRKAGMRTLVLRSDLEEWLSNLPESSPTPQAGV